MAGHPRGERAAGRAAARVPRAGAGRPVRGGTAAGGRGVRGQRRPGHGDGRRGTGVGRLRVAGQPGVPGGSCRGCPARPGRDDHDGAAPRRSRSPGDRPGTAHRPARPGRRDPARRRRRGTGRRPAAALDRPDRQPGAADRRVTTGRQTRHADRHRIPRGHRTGRPPAAVPARRDRGRRAGHRRGRGHRYRHLLRGGRPRPAEPARPQCVRPRRDGRLLDAYPAHARRGAAGAAADRVHPGHLGAGRPVRGRRCGRPGTRDAAGGHHHRADPRACGTARPGCRRQTAAGDPQPRRDGRVVHRQDRYPHAGPAERHLLPRPAGPARPAAVAPRVPRRPVRHRTHRPTGARRRRRGAAAPGRAARPRR